MMRAGWNTWANATLASTLPTRPMIAPSGAFALIKTENYGSTVFNGKTIFTTKDTKVTKEKRL
jgi:hypothetical protein